MTDKSKFIQETMGLTDEEVAGITGNEKVETPKEPETEEPKAEEPKVEPEKQADGLDIDERFKVFAEDGSLDVKASLKKVHDSWKYLKSEVGRTGQELGELRKKWNEEYLSKKKLEDIKKPEDLTEEKLNELMTGDLKGFYTEIKSRILSEVKNELIEEQQKHYKAIEEDTAIFAKEVQNWQQNHPEAAEYEDDMGAIFSSMSEEERIKSTENAAALMDRLYLMAENKRLKEGIKYKPKAPVQETKSNPQAVKNALKLSAKAKYMADKMGLSEEDLNKIFDKE